MRRAALSLFVGVWIPFALSLTASPGITAPLDATASLDTAASPNTAPPEPDGFWTGPTNDPVPNTIKGGKVIHTRDLAALLKRSKHPPVIVDVSNGPRRPDSLPATTAWIPVSHPGIPGALWIPGAGLGELPPTLDKYFRERLAAATGNDLKKPLVIYCHEKCWLSWNGVKRALQYGYRNVYWYPDGIEGWHKAKLPTVVVQPEPVP